MLDSRAAWLAVYAPEVDFNSVVLYRELVAHFGYAGSVQHVLRFVRSLCVPAQIVVDNVRSVILQRARDVETGWHRVV